MVNPRNLFVVPENAVRAHGAMFLFWVLMTIPSVIWWHDSILYVIFISLYAIWIAHLSGMQGALADRRVKRNAQSEAP